MRRDVLEKVYPPELHMELDTFMNCANVLPENVLLKIAESLQVKNTVFILNFVKYYYFCFNH